MAMSKSNPDDTRENIISEIDDKVLLCSICMKRFESPKILQCFHTFCEPCLTDWVKTCKGSLTCPTCRQNWPLTPRGVAGIPNNRFMNDLLELLSEVGSKSKTQLCEVCQGTADSWCRDCGQFFCKYCIRTHKVVPALKIHRVMSIEEYNEKRETESFKLLHPRFCDDHPESHLEFYCDRDSCQFPVCLKCTVVKHRTPHHDVIQLEDALKKYKPPVETHIGFLNETVQTLKKVKTDGTLLTDSFSKEQIAAATKINARFQKYCDEAKKEKDRLLKELDQTYAQRSKQINSNLEHLDLTLGNAESMHSYLSHVLQYGSAVDILSAKKVPEDSSLQTKAIKDHIKALGDIGGHLVFEESEKPIGINFGRVFITGREESTKRKFDLSGACVQEDDETKTLKAQVCSLETKLKDTQRQLKEAEDSVANYKKRFTEVQTQQIFLKKECEEWSLKNKKIADDVKVERQASKEQRRRLEEVTASREKLAEAHDLLQRAHSDLIKKCTQKFASGEACVDEDAKTLKAQVRSLRIKLKDLNDTQRQLKEAEDSIADYKKRYTDVLIQRETLRKEYKELSLKDKEFTDEAKVERQASKELYRRQLEEVTASKERLAKAHELLQRAHSELKKRSALDKKQTFSKEESQSHACPPESVPDTEGGKVRRAASNTKPECAVCLKTKKMTRKLACACPVCEDCTDKAKKEQGPICPICKVAYGIITGNMPYGKMTDIVEYCPWTCYPRHYTIHIKYDFEGGIQGREHPNPGKRYYGLMENGYLPDNKEGREVLRLLKIAFQRKLTFTMVPMDKQIGRIVWNGIEHKTNTTGGPEKNGYPDPHYIERVKQQLAAKGVK